MTSAFVDGFVRIFDRMSAASGALDTLNRGLTHSLDNTKEGLA